MGDLVRTTLLAWPYPGRWELPELALDELERHHALPLKDDPTPEDSSVTPAWSCSLATSAAA